MSPGPGVRRRYVGKTLRRLREARGLTVSVVAKKLGMAQPSLTRIENGRNAIMSRHVYRLCEIYEAGKAETDRLMRLAEESRERGWWESYSDVISDWFEIYASLESDADQILTYQSEFVPGLFQTPGYIRACFQASNPEASEAAGHRMVDLRQARQLRLQDRDVTALVNEGAVRRGVGGPDVMRAQLEYLITVIEKQHAKIRIVPFTAGAHPAMSGPFTMLKFPDMDEIDLVYLENERGSLYLERPADLLRYTDVFTQTQRAALSPAESADLLRKIVQET
ncbi:XRE family transcriptional regulator [Amycolatopsis balhimycina DSM 5908]|uniref:XRE family transcriptional regulator n=1 Tax=Amycolatopsis balhimycina DSM 5908 TaxID=1081091 RepID=A0A428WHF6_AMYBA|nr:helix-turn-helix transcriptional regulator [Amycolatopsis balhimycina]RSM42466.1 XRE family transcriptional regulator [Amycolatopsis balhimycina DSM 5908]